MKQQQEQKAVMKLPPSSVVQVSSDTSLSSLPPWVCGSCSVQVVVVFVVVVVIICIVCILLEYGW
jgi:hypothetical protein